MQDIAIRLGILLSIGIAVWLLVQLCRRFIAVQRRQALAAAPLSTLPISDNVVRDQTEADRSRVRILAFSSADCRQCQQLQTPALQHAVAARGDAIAVVEIDATSQHELAETYHVLTVPSTVILDAAGQAQAINYGFASAQRLLTQIDEVLTKK